MKTSMNIKTIVSICLFIAVVGISSTAPAAEWMFSQGNVSEIEYLTNCSSYYYKGWGLDLNLKSGSSNWIHMTVPTPYGSTVGYGAKTIRLKIYTGSADAWISDVHVYNGNSKVHEFTGLTYSNGWKDFGLTMPSKINFNKGMGISICIKAGVEMMSHRFIFSSAGAYFY